MSTSLKELETQHCWVWEEFELEDGDWFSDFYCQNCYLQRNWNLDESDEPSCDP